MSLGKELQTLGYKAKIISTIVDFRGLIRVALGYKANIISTIVDCNNRLVKEHRL